VDEYFQRLESSSNELTFTQASSLRQTNTRRKDSLAKFIATLAARVPFARTLLDDIAGEHATDNLQGALDDPILFEKNLSQ